MAQDVKKGDGLISSTNFYEMVRSGKACNLLKREAFSHSTGLAEQEERGPASNRCYGLALLKEALIRQSRGREAPRPDVAVSS